MSKFRVDADLEIYLDAGLGADDPFFKDDNVIDLLAQALREAWQSPDGRELKNRVGDAFDAKVPAEIKKRFDSCPYYPSIAFRSRIEEIIHDLLITETSPKPVPPKVNLRFDPPKPKASADAEKFAFAYNRTIKTRGCAAVKPRGGLVILEMPNGSEYEWPAERAEQLLNECYSFSLIS